MTNSSFSDSLPSPSLAAEDLWELARGFGKFGGSPEGLATCLTGLLGGLPEIPQHIKSKDFSGGAEQFIGDIFQSMAARDLQGITRALRSWTQTLVDRGIRPEDALASFALFRREVLHHLWTDASQPPLPRFLFAFDNLCSLALAELLRTYFDRGQQCPEMKQGVQERESDSKKVRKRQGSSFHGLVGASPVMQELYGQIEAVSRSRAPVLIVGESGSGKELVARAVHLAGPDPKSPFIALNCATLPESLFESQLFGHIRGAFTSATRSTLGLFRAADGGTLFLDEITEMPPNLQAKLLRVIQERQLRPLGSTHEVAIDVRLVVATNRNLQRALDEGSLRGDLFYRLESLMLNLPPLRQRSEDIPLLVEHALGLLKERHWRQVSGVSQKAMEALRRYEWPGNVRQLIGVFERALTFGRGQVIEIGDLPRSIVDSETEKPRPTLAPSSDPLPLMTFVEAERSLLRRALELAEGNKTRAAASLGISRKQLYQKIRKYRLD